MRLHDTPRFERGQATAELALLLVLVALSCLFAEKALMDALDQSVTRTALLLSAPLP